MLLQVQMGHQKGETAETKSYASQNVTWCGCRADAGHCPNCVALHHTGQPPIFPLSLSLFFFFFKQAILSMPRFAAPPGRSAARSSLLTPGSPAFQHELRVRLVRAALRSPSKESLHRHKHHNSQRPESHAASDRTALLESSGMPLIGTMLLLYFDVIFPVSRLKPENWTVAPSTLSMSDPTRPAANPAAWCILFSIV